MLLQAFEFNIINIIFVVVLYLISVVVTRWLAKIQEYSDEWLPAFVLNALWYGMILLTWLLVYVIFRFPVLLLQIHFIFALPANIFFGIILVQHEKNYDIDFIKDAVKFVITNLMVLFIILIVAFFVSIFFFAMAT